MSKEKILKTCDIAIEWSFYSLLVVVTFSTSLVEIFSSVMIAAWLVKMILRKDIRSVDSIPVRILLLYWAWTVLSCVNSGYFSESLRGIFKWGEYGLLFIVAATELRGEKTVKKALYALTGATVLVTLNGFAQYFTGEDLIRHRQLIYQDYLNRVSSSFVHPNDYGVYLLVVAMIFISFLISQGSRLRERFLVAVPAALSMVSLFLTKSRGAWISFAAAFFVLGTLKSRRMVALFLAMLLVVFIILPYTAQQRIFDLADLQGGTTWERLMLWKGTVNMIKVHPVMGFGVNTYSRNFPKYKPPDYFGMRYTHNSYLHMAAEVGCVGALLFMVFLVTTLTLSLRGIFVLAEGRRKAFAVGLFAAMAGFSMNCIVDTHLYSVNLAVFFHLLLGYCFALSCYARKD